MDSQRMFQSEEEEEVPFFDVNSLLSQFGEKLSCQRPNSRYKLWVFWSSSSANSDKIQDQFRSLLLKLQEFHMYQTGERTLIQFWAPVIIDGRCFLTTSNQPFGLNKIDEELCSYRKHSLQYKFNVEEDLAFPAHAFRLKLPQYTPDLRYFSNEEHPWCDRVSNCNPLQLYALPVFDPSSKSCTGILEIVTDEFSWPYLRANKAEMDKLQELYLKPCFAPFYFRDDTILMNEVRFNRRLEISQALEVVCNTHGLPLALTWLRCPECSSLEMKSRSSFLDNSADVLLLYKAYKLNDFEIPIAGMLLKERLQFGMHLKKGQGVAGKAYLSKNSCFCSNITQFTFSQYPLAHITRYCNCTGSFAICLCDKDTEEVEGVVEFFLPRNETNGYPRTLLDSILATMKHHLHYLKPFGEEQGVESLIETIIFSNLPLNQVVTTIDQTLPNVTATQDVRTMTIRALYGSDLLKFKISSTSGMVNLNEEIIKRLKIESFKIKYRDDSDEFKDWILLTCDEDLQLCMNTSIRLGITIIEMLVEPITN